MLRTITWRRHSGALSATWGSGGRLCPSELETRLFHLRRLKTGLEARHGREAEPRTRVVFERLIGRHDCSDLRAQGESKSHDRGRMGYERGEAVCGTTVQLLQCSTRVQQARRICSWRTTFNQSRCNL